MKGMLLLLQDRRGNDTHRQVESQSDDLKLAKQEVVQAKESLKVTRGEFFSNVVMLEPEMRVLKCTLSVRDLTDLPPFYVQLCADKHQAERKKWLEEKLSLIGQAKEAEDKRNHEMRKFADDRERYTRQQSQMVGRG